VFAQWLLRALGLVPWLATLVPCAASAQSALASGRKYPPRVYETRQLAGAAPVIDGRLDDAAWQEGVWAGGYTQQLPMEGAATS
jgi:hypothetical protein